MNNKVLHKADVQYFVEETAIEQALEATYDEAKDLSFAGLDKTDENEKSSIIELRNDPIISRLHDYRRFVSDQVVEFGRAVLANKVSLRVAISSVFRVNLILGTKYSIQDLYKGAKIVSSEDPEAYDKVYVEYNSVDLGIINTYKSRLEKMCMACHDCLFNDLFDKETLYKYLPVIYFLNTLY